MVRRVASSLALVLFVVTATVSAASAYDNPVVRGGVISNTHGNYPNPDLADPDRTHVGIDIAAGCGSKVYAYADGVVSAVVKDESDWRYQAGKGKGNLGYAVAIQHPAGANTWNGRPFSTVYLHLYAPPLVGVGDGVTGGETIGQVGKTPDYEGCHTHFEVRYFSDAVKGFWNPRWGITTASRLKPNIYGEGDQRQSEVFLKDWEDPEKLFDLETATAEMAESNYGEGERILGFDSEIWVHPDATMTVRETITVIAQDLAIKRGIYRDFPTSYKDRFNNKVVVGFEVLGVLRNGKPEPYQSERIDNGVRLYIGDKDVFIPKGQHIYTIDYRTNQQLGFFEGFDELYWNVTGNGWAFVITRASARVHLPEGAHVVDHAAYTGRMGEQGSDFTSDFLADGGMLFETTRELDTGEGLTIAVAWPSGYVDLDRVRTQLEEEEKAKTQQAQTVNWEEKQAQEFSHRDRETPIPTVMEVTPETAYELIKHAKRFPEPVGHGFHLMKHAPIAREVERMTREGYFVCGRMGKRVFSVTQKGKYLVEDCMWNAASQDYGITLYTHKLDIVQIVEILTDQSTGTATVTYEVGLGEAPYLEKLKEIDPQRVKQEFGGQDIESLRQRRKAYLKKWDQGWRVK